MKLAQCDQCDKKVLVVGIYAQVPQDWYLLTKSGGHNADGPERHYCSPSCLIAFGQAEEADAAALVAQEAAKESDAGDDIPY